eukprot:m.1431363 g.1431363  ORF g.1431363 m.1431363 type:complete len:73 (-) comp25075_c0_seq31:2562-2780(-)
MTIHPFSMHQPSSLRHQHYAFTPCRGVSAANAPCVPTCDSEHTPCAVPCDRVQCAVSVVVVVVPMASAGAWW